MKHVDVLDLPDGAREMIRECEARGEQTVFERNGRPVAILVSHDEYLALRETIQIANDALLFAKLAEADEEVTSGRLSLSPLEEGQTPDASPVRRLQRMRLTSAAEEGLELLEGVERRRVLAALARIDNDPIAGAPLFEPLKGLWSHLVGDVRIIYRIVAEARMVAVLSIARSG